MDRLKIFAAALLCLTISCSKISGPENKFEDDDITVSVSDAATKSVLSGDCATAFASGDRILVYDDSGNKATYKFRTFYLGKYVFQMETKDASFVKENIVSAFYPAEKVTSSGKMSFTAEFGAEQSYAENSFPNGAAPMSWFGNAGNDIEFKNQFAVVRFSFKYASAPQTALKLQTVALTSASSKLCGTFTFTKDGASLVSGESSTVTLTGCDAAGDLSTIEKYYYIAVPALQNASEDMTVLATPTTDVPFGGTFTAQNTGTSGNVIKANNILRMEPFILSPVAYGSFNVDDWGNDGKIKVGQITLSETDVTLSSGDTKKIKINGVSDWEKIQVKVVTGDDSIFTTEKTTDTGKDHKTEYYISITGKGSGTGKIFVNDQVTNSGSYIDIKVD